MPNITEFQEKVYLHLLLIPPGQVTTYGTLAKVLGSSPRAVGGALRCNPFSPTVPCHRVIASDGSIGGFKGEWKTTTSSSASASRSTPTPTQTPQLGLKQSQKVQYLQDEGIEFIQDRNGKFKLRMQPVVVSAGTLAATGKKKNMRTTSSTAKTSMYFDNLESDAGEDCVGNISAETVVDVKNDGDDDYSNDYNYGGSNKIWFNGPWDTSGAEENLNRIMSSTSTSVSTSM